MPEPAAEPAAEPGGRLVGGGPRWRVVAVVAGLLALTAVLVVTAVYRGPQFSLFDESTHADYAWEISHGQVPAAGDTLAPEIRQEWSCHGGIPGLVLPACGATGVPASAYPARGENYNFAHPPLYYLITGSIARVLDAAYPGQNFVTAARLVGLLWLLAAMAVLYVALRRFSASRPFAAVATAFLPLTPLVLHASTTVTNDAAAALSGALALFVLARLAVQQRLGWLVPAAATAFATATKVINAVPLLVVAVLFGLLAVLRWRAGDRRSARSIGLAGGAVLVSFLTVYGGWMAFQSGRGLPGWTSPVAGVSDRPVHGLPFNELLSTSFSGFPLTSTFYLPPAVNGQAVGIWVRLLTALVVAAPFVALLVFTRPTPAWLVGLGTLAGMALFPLAVEVQVYVSSGHYFPVIVPRYGMSLIPWAFGCLALAASYRRERLGTAAVTAIGGVAMVATVTGLM